MTSRPTQEEAAARARAQWVITPLESVGPLRFGMTVDEAAAALPGAHEARRFQADPISTDIVGIELSFSPAGPALYEYFTSGSGLLYCIAGDIIRGPRMTLNGTELTGGNPARLEDWLVELAQTTGTRLSFGPRGNPGINDLGLVLRVQDTPDGLRTRPVLVGREWADRCADDWQGMIPECEWVGYVWPGPSFAQGKQWWTPPDYESRWSGWQAPF